jgi:hypothetical protein
LNLKNNLHVYKNLDGEKIKNPNRKTLRRDYYNSSYYGDPYAYDFNNSELKDLSGGEDGQGKDQY